MTDTQMQEEFRHRAEEMGLQIDAFSSGPETARVAFVGQGPGEQEARKGIPFVGPSGRLLWRHLEKYRLKPDNVYCTNVVKRQLSTRNDAKILPDELGKWTDLVRWELSQLPKLEVVFILGGYALEALTDESGILNWRGSVIPVSFDTGRRNVQAVCTINPVVVLDTPRTEIMFAMDCNRLDTVIKGTFKPYVIEELINPSFKQAMGFIADLKKQKKPVSLDIEAINNETACIGLANDGHRAMCINFRDHKRNRFTISDECDILLATQDLCESHQIIAQNAAFDAYWTWLRDRLRVRMWHCTMLAHHTLYPQLPHNLGFLTGQYTTHPYYKDDFEQWKEGGDIDTFWRYNCKDAAVTWEVCRREIAELSQRGLGEFFYNHVMHAHDHLIQATVHGVAVDEKVKDHIKELCRDDLEIQEREFYRLVEECTDNEGYMPNPNSWKQLQVLFFDYLHLKGRGRSTDETNRKYMMKDKGTRPIDKEMLVQLGKYKEEAKFYGTYAESRVSSDGRFRCEYKQAGVTNAPGRLSSSQLLDGDGGNMQNQPVRARAYYTADDGCVFFYFDLGQAEARVVGWRADIKKWIEQFEQARKDGKYDAHRALASEMFNIPYDKTPEKDWDENDQPTKRYIAKRCRHGLNYRMERERLSEVTELPYHLASQAFVLYHKINPELTKWWEFEENNFKKNRVTHNALGREFRVFQTIDEEVLRSVVAFYPQSTIGDKVTQVWYQSEEDDKWPRGKARIAIDVHDNLIGIATPDVAKRALSICKKYAESPILIKNIYGKTVPLIIPAECKISYPTSSRIKKGKIEFYKDPKGLHRWSHMETVHL